MRDVAAGRFPPADGGVTILPQPGDRDAGVIGFTAHAVVFIDADPAWVTAQRPAGDLASVRAFLAAGFEPVGAEAHLACRTFGV